MNKKETMEETIIDTIKESKDRYRLHINYQYEIEVNEGEYYVVRRKPQYPKSYEECCAVLRYDPYRIDDMGETVIGYKRELIRVLQMLLICRDAYWKLAGEEMGLGKSWNPISEKGYCTYAIIHHTSHIRKSRPCADSALLEFPTEEMRDAFYENFKDLIEQCKELL